MIIRLAASRFRWPMVINGLARARTRGDFHMYDPTKGPFWAGGNADGWFVNMHKEPDVHPGSATDIRVRWFWSRDHVNGELGAALAAEALVADLNAAMMGAELVTTLKRAALALVYAADCMGSCDRPHEDGIANTVREREIIEEALKIARA